jgi:hypothetical protein
VTTIPCSESRKNSGTLKRSGKKATRRLAGGTRATSLSERLVVGSFFLFFFLRVAGHWEAWIGLGLLNTWFCLPYPFQFKPSWAECLAGASLFYCGYRGVFLLGDARVFGSIG